MKLLVARHGECETNRLGIIAGARTDSPLTERGWQDARALAAQLVGFRGLIVSSPLRRALNTAEVVRDCALPGAPIRVDEAFVERDVGEATGWPLERYFAAEKAGTQLAGAESEQTMYERVKRGLETLQAADETTLLVAHNGTYRMIVCILQGWPPHRFSEVPYPTNGEVHTLEL